MCIVLSTDWMTKMIESKRVKDIHTGGRACMGCAVHVSTETILYVVINGRCTRHGVCARATIVYFLWRFFYVVLSFHTGCTLFRCPGVGRHVQGETSVGVRARGQTWRRNDSQDEEQDREGDTGYNPTRISPGQEILRSGFAGRKDRWKTPECPGNRRSKRRPCSWSVGRLALLILNCLVRYLTLFSKRFAIDCFSY